MIEFHQVKKIYGTQTALSVENLQIKQGECVGLIGNNGAGKTTLLSLILDLIPATEGFVKSKDKIVSKTEDWKTYTGSFLNEGFLIPYLTPIEFLEFIAGLHHKNIADVKQFIADNAGFYVDNMYEKKYLRELSAGNKNKVGILATMLINPEIIILDEPFANLDPSSQSWLKLKIKELHANGITFIISSHDLRHVTEISSRVLLIENGLIIKDTHTNPDTLQELENYFQPQFS